jgi:hypothetical protein
MPAASQTARPARLCALHARGACGTVRRPHRRLTYPGDLSRGTTSATRDFRTIVWRIKQLGFNAVRLPFTFAHFADAPAPTDAPCYAETAVRPSPPLRCGPLGQSEGARPHARPVLASPRRPGAALAMTLLSAATEAASAPPPRRARQALLDLSVTPPASLPAFNATTLPASGAAAPPQAPPVLPAGACNAGMPATSTRDRYLWVVQYLIDEGLCALRGPGRKGPVHEAAPALRAEAAGTWHLRSGCSHNLASNLARSLPHA